MKIRNCNSQSMSTGVSACPIDLAKVKGALVVPKGYKLPATLDGEALEEACHAASASRVLPILPFVEYAPSGGEVQVSAIGYGPNKANGLSARTDVWTMDKYYLQLASAITKAMNTEWDAYYFDENNVIYGVNDGTDVLAGFSMSTIYNGGMPHPTSGAAATQTIAFCHKDARDSIENIDFEQLAFDIERFAKGLVPVKFVRVGDTGSNKWKLVEALGGLDRTAEFGPTIAQSPTTTLVGITTGVTYNEADATLTITGATAPQLKAPADLYTAGVKFIVGA